MRPFVIPAAIAIAALPRPAAAQVWKEIGKTASNTIVFVDAKSITRAGDSVTATMRSRFATPDGDGITGARTIATFNCAKERVAVKENDSYKGTHIVKRAIPKLPGYGVVLGGSVTSVAFKYLCSNQP